MVAGCGFAVQVKAVLAINLPFVTAVRHGNRSSDGTVFLDHLLDLIPVRRIDPVGAGHLGCDIRHILRRRLYDAAVRIVRLSGGTDENRQVIKGQFPVSAITEIISPVRRFFFQADIIV